MISPIKWTGSKRHLAPELVKLFPEKYSVGGGNLLPYYNSPVQAGDIIPELIDLWMEIKERPDELLRQYSKLWAESPDNYYDIRQRFNRNRNPVDFLFLSRTCVNGLIRFNKSGDFNSPLHLGRKGIAPENLAKIFNSWSPILNKIQFTCTDYRDLLEKADSDTFVFLDPPYLNFAGRMYSGDFNHQQLFEVLENAKFRWLMTFDSSSDLPFKKALLDSGSNSYARYRGKESLIQEAVYMNYS